MRGLVSPIAPNIDLQESRLPLYLHPSLPSVFTFEITARCQHRCAGCGNVFPHTRREMDVSQWEQIISKLHPYIKGLRITGGEPTLHPQFPVLLRQINRLNVPFVLFTNGNWSHADAIIDLLKDCTNLEGILVSLHGNDPDSYAKFTGVNAYDKVVKNIRLACSSGLRVATNTLLLSTTVNKISEIANLALSAGAANCSFGRYYGPVLQDLSPSDMQLKQALTQISKMRKRDKRISLSNCVPTCFSPEEDFGGGGCTSGITHCTIGPLGEVRPCTHSEVVLGSMPEDDIGVLWHSPALYRWRNLIPDDCITCAALNVCRGGCRAVAQKLSLHHDPLHVRALETPNRQEVVKLGMLDRPKLSCSVESTEYGFALTRAGRFTTLSHKSGDILQVLDGKTTIKTILSTFGPASLELIGGLLQQQMLELN